MTLIERLVSEPSEETTELLFEDERFVFWVDWREDDAVLAEYCESIIESEKLRSSWQGDKLVVQYGDAVREVPLTQSGADRHITLMTINEVLNPDYEIRFVWDSNGGDTLAFTALASKEWSALESTFGVDRVAGAFLKLTERPNTFTDPLQGDRPGQASNNIWWKFWR